MKHFLLSVMTISVAVISAAQPRDPAPAKLLIAFSSYRERPKHPNIFFYEHDGVASGKIVGSVGTSRSADASGQPSLSQDGRYCAFTFEIENKTARIYFWDRKEHKLVDLPALNDSPNALLAPSLAGDGNLLAFAGWNRPGGPGPGYHVFLYDRSAKKLVDLPGLNSQAFDDRTAGKYLPLPGLNTMDHEYSPSLSPDGRFLAFVSERLTGAGERDIYVYDRHKQALLPTPGLNSATEDFDPCVMVIK